VFGLNKENIKIAIVGLGYVGLPLAIEFGKHYETIGFDVSTSKVDSYRAKCDPNDQVGVNDFQLAKSLSFTNSEADLVSVDVFIVAVPTPVDKHLVPDFYFLIEASKIVGKVMKRDAIIIYESTVYPGATEEVCIPVLEKYSKMLWKVDFNVGYSPERVNPGDQTHRLTNIVKVVAADTQETLEFVDRLYASIIEAGTYKASSIAVAEAAKVFENTQRDLNIALVNEFAIILGKMGLRSKEVLDAAATKWNFLNFRPGLVGGHCIGVDPYYLAHKAQSLGYHPDVIHAGRRINDGMSGHVTSHIAKLLNANGLSTRGSRILVLGLTFKENCPDLRNSKVVDIYHQLRDMGCDVSLHDPVADQQEIFQIYGSVGVEFEGLNGFDGIVISVAHSNFQGLTLHDYKKMLKAGGVIVDIKSTLDPLDFSGTGITLWQL
jgi:UDP-N-acetyl-D-galactosamine dehydrogenase